MNFRSWFRQETPESFNADLLKEAKREIVKHEAVVEYSTAQIHMYQARIARLEPTRDIVREEL